MTPAEKSARTKRATKIGACLILGLGGLRLTVLAPDGEASGPRGLEPAGAEASTDTGPTVTYLPIEPARDPFLPVNGG